MALYKEMEKRLIYAKYLFLHGQEHAKDSTAVGRMVAIHNFDNAVEFVLKCIATKYDIQSKKKIDLEFKDLWNEIITNGDYKKEIIEELPLKREMFGLHDLRNGVQHHGNIPSEEDTIRYMKEAEDFLKEVMKKVFKTDYYELSLANLIENEEIKSLMKEAEKMLGEINYEKSIKLSSEAFYLAGIEEQNKMNNCLLGHAGSIDFLNFSSIIMIGIDFRDFAKFRLITPTSHLTCDASEAIKRCKNEIDNWGIDPSKQTKSNAQYCFNFALKYILKWQSFWKEEEV